MYHIAYSERLNQIDIRNGDEKVVDNWCVVSTKWVFE